MKAIIGLSVCLVALTYSKQGISQHVVEFTGKPGDHWSLARVPAPGEETYYTGLSLVDPSLVVVDFFNDQYSRWENLAALIDSLDSSVLHNRGISRGGVDTSHLRLSFYRRGEYTVSRTRCTNRKANVATLRKRRIAPVNLSCKTKTFPVVIVTLPEVPDLADQR